MLDAGRVTAFSLDGTERRRFEGFESGARIGSAASAILPRQLESGGIFIGAPAARGGRGILAFYEISGALRGTRVGSGTHDRLGAVITPAADFDGDGREEVAVSAPGADGESGRVLVIGTSGTVFDELIGPSGSGFGAALAAPGDVDGDGFSDLLIGASRLGGEPGHAGTWLLLSGLGGTPNPPGDPIDPPPGGPGG
jgi:hypothetical protein